ncbi:MAG TPA: hypothetical protein VNN55_09080 [bacterium]|nr:hypothetical protein [bacterium]
MNALERARAVRAGIERAFLAQGGTPEQWARVAADPRKFNLAWRRLLGLPDGTLPPPEEYRNIDPSTGEIVGAES